MRISRRASSTSASLEPPAAAQAAEDPFEAVGQGVEHATVRLPAARAPTLSLEEGVDELVGVEGDQVVGALAEPDELDGETELALDGDDDAPLGRCRRAW